jgi:hypothetical protein|nr:hypothetical protein Q903MT_gene690 [Picea sitchensis]
MPPLDPLPSSLLLLPLMLILLRVKLQLDLILGNQMDMGL